LTEGKQAPAPAPSHQASNDDLSGMEHWHPELFAKLQRRRCLTEGKQAPHGQLEAIAARHESERERLLCAQRARLRAADRKPVRMARASTGATRTGLSMAKPFAAVSYDPSSSGQERSEGAEAAAEAADGSLLDYQAATCSAHAVQVFDIMEASEGFDEHDESDDDDGGFGALETLLPREVSRRGLEACKIVNLIDLAESDMDTASTCSSLEMTQDIGRCWERAAESDSRNREIQYLQQRLADAQAEQEIHRAAAREEAAATQAAFERLERQHAALEAQALAAEGEAEVWRRKAADLQASNDELRQAARQALRALMSQPRPAVP